MKPFTFIAVLALTSSALAQPANNNFASPTVVTGSEVSVTGSNAGATKETNEPNHAGNAGGNSVWWSWTAPDSTNVIVSTAGSNFDTLLAVYTGDTIGGLTLVAENDDSGGTTSAVAFAAVAGTTYQIAVDGYNDAGNISSGDIQLTITPQDDGGGGGGGGPTVAPGTYSGLILVDGAPEHETSGYITIRVTPQGRFSSKLIIGGNKYSAAGSFDENNLGTAQLRGRLTEPATLELQADESGEVLFGTVGDLDFVAEPAAAAQAGRFTVAIPGAEDWTVAPGGTGYGAVTVSSTGQLRFKGVLADGTKASQSTAVSGSGQWPLYVPLYKGMGSIVGWVTFDPDAEDVVSGPVTWSKLAGAKSKNYPDGFILDTSVIGSPFVTTSPPLDLTEAVVQLTGAQFAEPLTQDVLLNSKGQVTSASGDRSVKIKVNSKTGLVKGTVVDPDSNAKMKVNGVVLQDRGFAAGYFLGNNQSGDVYLGP